MKAIKPILIGSAASPKVTSITAAAVNKDYMFDGKTGTGTTCASSMTVVLTPAELCNSLALMAMVADAVTVTVTDPTAGVVYSYAASLMDLADVVDFYTWCFSPLRKKENIVLTDLPAYPSASITVVVTAAAITVGSLIIGTTWDLGTTLYGTQIGIQDYSSKSVEAVTGRMTITERRYAKIASFSLTMPKTWVPYVQRLLADHRAVAMVYIGDATAEETIIYGFFKAFSIVHESFRRSNCSIDVEELS